MSRAPEPRAGAPVVVSGSGVVSPTGVGLAAFEEALFAGRSAVRAHAVDLPGLEVPIVPIAAVAGAAFDAASVGAPSRLPLDRATAMALAAAEEAARQAALAIDDVDGERLGIFWGSGMAGANTFEQTCRTVYADQRRMRPTSVITTMPNAPTAELALRYRARGAALAYACACASSAVAIGEAMRAIRAGWIDVAIAGGSESLLTPGVLASWQAMRVLTPLAAGTDREASAQRACRPFSIDRAGFALGEAAAAFVLESAEHARARGATVRFDLAGYATNCDGVHITNPDAIGQARAMRAALADAGLSADAIGYLNAHGTATMNGDAAEADSIATVFGTNGVPVSSTKAIHGHLLGAGGAVELLAAARALASERLPPTANTTALDPAFAIDLVTVAARPARGLAHVMSSSFAFGGTNAVLVASRAGPMAAHGVGP